MHLLWSPESIFALVFHLNLVLIPRYHKNVITPLGRMLPYEVKQNVVTGYYQESTFIHNRFHTSPPKYSFLLFLEIPGEVYAPFSPP